MTRELTRRTLLGGLAAAMATSASGLSLEKSLRPLLRPDGLADASAIQSMIRSARLGGAVSFAVSDTRSGTLLEGSDERKGLPPASVAKAITALYALDRLGPDHRFATRLIRTGSISNGVLHGDLVLVGGGDPTLDTDGLASLAAQLKEAGVREVRGAFLVSDGAIPRASSIDPEQPDHVGYAPGLSGIALNFNRVHFEWKRAGTDYTVTMQARTARFRPAVAMSQMQVADRNAPVYRYRNGGGHDDWSVARGALGKGGARWLPIKKPSVYAGEVFQTLARSHGIVLPAARIVRKRPKGHLLAQTESQPLVEIAKGMLRHSTNITAEMIGCMASATFGSTPGSLRASAQIMNTWAETRLGIPGMALVDHSGLGDQSRLTAKAMVDALVWASKEDNLKPILRSYAMRDSNGRPDKDHPISVVAKTGTLNFVSGLAGYLQRDDGREMAFAIFSADTDTRAGIPRAARERPPGARSWNRRARSLQRQLIERWGTRYS